MFLRSSLGFFFSFFVVNFWMMQPVAKKSIVKVFKTSLENVVSEFFFYVVKCFFVYELLNLELLSISSFVFVHIVDA